MGSMANSVCFADDQAAATAACSSARWGGQADYSVCTSVIVDAPGSAVLSITSYPTSGAAAHASTVQLPLFACEQDLPDPATLGGFWAFACGTIIVLFLVARHAGAILRLIRG